MISIGKQKFKPHAKALTIEEKYMYLTTLKIRASVHQK